MKSDGQWGIGSRGPFTIPQACFVGQLGVVFSKFCNLGFQKPISLYFLHLRKVKTPCCCKMVAIAMRRGFDVSYFNSEGNGKGFSKRVYAPHLNSNLLLNFSSFSSCGTPKNTDS